MHASGSVAAAPAGRDFGSKKDIDPMCGRTGKQDRRKEAATGAGLVITGRPAEREHRSAVDSESDRYAAGVVRLVIVIPYRSASATVASSSSRIVRPASIASAVAPAACMLSMVWVPTVGTSKRLSCCGLAILTT